MALVACKSRTESSSLELMVLAKATGDKEAFAAIAFESNIVFFW